MNPTDMKPDTDKITFTMFKISGGIKIQEFNLQALSDSHAVEVATDLYNRKRTNREVLLPDLHGGNLYHRIINPLPKWHKNKRDGNR